MARALETSNGHNDRDLYSAKLDWIQARSSR
jgi:hypothetical protein